jgi:hypothetical protein
VRTLQQELLALESQKDEFICDFSNVGFSLCLDDFYITLF